jgi:hypothetical protein
MTTIVYANNEMAWDSRTTAGSAIASDDSQKRHVLNGVTFWMAGTVGDYEEFFLAYFGGRASRKLNVAAFILDKGKLHRAGFDDGEVWLSPVRFPEAIGSGSEHAITAIDCGCTPAQAVRMAAKRDTRTGGKIRTQKLKLS